MSVLFEGGHYLAQSALSAARDTVPTRTKANVRRIIPDARELALGGCSLLIVHAREVSFYIKCIFVWRPSSLVYYISLGKLQVCLL